MGIIKTAGTRGLPLLSAIDSISSLICLADKALTVKHMTDTHEIFTNLSALESEMLFSYIMKFGNTMPEHTLNQALSALLKFQESKTETGRSYINAIR